MKEQTYCYRAMLKKPPIVDHSLRRGAKEAHCMECDLPGATGRVVLAHLPYKDAGVGQKCSDFHGAYLCDGCHAYCDKEGRADFEFKFRVLRRQMDYLFRNGIWEL